MKKIPKQLFLALIFLGLISLRFTNILSIPLFGDEALYLWLATEIPKNHNMIFSPITWGLMPIMIWLEAILLVPMTKLVDPLTAGRILSVSFDLISCFLVYQISLILFKDKKISILSSIVYLSLPLNFLHSRLVLFESLTNMFSLLGVYFLIKHFLDPKQLKNIFLSILFLVLGFFTKPLAAVVFLPLLIFPFFQDLSEQKFSKHFSTTTKKVVVFFSLLGLIILIFYYPISREFQSRFLVEKSNDPLFYLEHLKQNIHRAWWWLQAYLTLPIIFILIGGVTISILKKNYLMIWVGVWSLLIVLIESLVSAHFFPRHLYPLAAPISILVGYFLSTLIKQKRILLVLTIIVLLNPWKTNFEIITDPRNASIALEDKQQLFEDWTSGTGLQSLADNLNVLAKDQKIVVFTENNPSLFWGLNNLYNTKNVEFVVSENINKGQFVEDQLLTACGNSQMYVLLNKDQTPSGAWPVRLESSTEKNPDRSINLYKITK